MFAKVTLFSDICNLSAGVHGWRGGGEFPLRVKNRSQRLKVALLRPPIFGEFENKIPPVANKPILSVQPQPVGLVGLMRLISPIVQLFQPPKQPFPAPKRPFQPREKGLFGFRYGLYRAAIWPISHSNMGHIASRNAFKGVLAGAKPPAGFYFAGKQSVKFRAPDAPRLFPAPVVARLLLCPRTARRSLCLHPPGGGM